MIQYRSVKKTKNYILGYMQYPSHILQFVKPFQTVKSPGVPLTLQRSAPPALHLHLQEKTETRGHDRKHPTSNLDAQGRSGASSRGARSTAASGPRPRPRPRRRRSRSRSAAGSTTCRTHRSRGRAAGHHEGCGAVGRGGAAVLGFLLGDAEAGRVAGAVVVAGQEVPVLLAEAGPVVASAGRDLGLELRDAGVEDPNQ